MRVGARECLVDQGMDNRYLGRSMPWFVLEDSEPPTQIVRVQYSGSEHQRRISHIFVVSKPNYQTE